MFLPLANLVGGKNIAHTQAAQTSRFITMLFAKVHCSTSTGDKGIDGPQKGAMVKPKNRLLLMLLVHAVILKFVACLCFI